MAKSLEDAKAMLGDRDAEIQRLTKQLIAQNDEVLKLKDDLKVCGCGTVCVISTALAPHRAVLRCGGSVATAGMGQ